ncbi:hypothetical protein P8452_64665 [Trifolium repens]|nr:hypothetical protein P8452_64665 [Trifolium repens]
MLRRKPKDHGKKIRRLIGDAAKNQTYANPENTVFDAKRLIESEKINNAITVSMNLLDKNNQQKEIDVLEGHLKQLDSMFENLKAKTG